MDREADSYEIFNELQKNRFVIRLTHDRRVELEGGVLSEVLQDAPVLVEREITLSPRSHAKRKKSGKPVPPRSRKRYPVRTGRTAAVQIRALTVPIRRPQQVPASLPASLELNVVEVVEPSPPDGEKAVRWVLITTEPIETASDLASIVDIYRKRWLIEEFFDALKNGCALSERRPESLRTAENGFALLSVMAWQLVLLRQLERTASTAPATTLFSKKRLQALRDLLPSKEKLPPNPRVSDLCRAFARLGGHLRSNGAPGWKVLGRGYRDFLAAEAYATR